MLDAVAIGELLIDFTPAGTGVNGAALFARNPGGAPANVLAVNSRLGGKTAFIGKVGDDPFGRFLKTTLEDLTIDTRGLMLTREADTTLAFVHLDATGNRSFSFYRRPGADTLLSREELNADLIRNTRILHFGSLSMTAEPSRGATIEAVRMAKQAGALISFDPNYRPSLWESPAQAVVQMKAGLHQADLVKLSEEELTFLTGKTDLDQGARLLQQFGTVLVLVTLGPKGTYYRIGEKSRVLPTYDVRTIDTNGAGDAFTGALHYRLRGKTAADLRGIGIGELEDMLDFANAVGALVTTKSGAIPAIPSLQEVEECRLHIPHLQG